jgi:DNA polymerase-3 subunit delta'
MLIGHQRILDFLRRSVERRKIAHAYLFAGPENVGKRSVAIEFIKMLGCDDIEKDVHPDVLIVEPEIIEKKGVKKEKEITIDQARQIRHQMSLFPYQAPYKIVLIDQAERMTREASNALLKTLEEPSGRAILILITANPQLLLPTIVSRCQLVKFLLVSSQEIEKHLSAKYEIRNTRYERIIRLACGRPGLAIQYLKNPKLLQDQDKILTDLQKLLQSDLNERYLYAEKLAKDIQQARQILNTWLLYFRDLLLLVVGCQDLALLRTVPQGQSSEDCPWRTVPGGLSLNKLKNIIQAIKKTDLLLANPSINARLALEVLMLEL